MERKTYYDAEPWYQREKTRAWHQQMEASNEAFKRKLGEHLAADTEAILVLVGLGAKKSAANPDQNLEQI